MMSWWGWLAMRLCMLAFWGLIVWAVVALFRDWGGDRPSRSAPTRSGSWRSDSPEASSTRTSTSSASPRCVP